MSFLGVDQKQGSQDRLDGRLTVYARVELDPEEAMSGKHPIASMILNGLLVAQGNYKEQSNLRDFLKSEMGLSLEEGLGEFLDKLDGIESALDPAKLKEKMESLDDIQDFIPTPAKIVPFRSEQEILAQEGDIFFVGEFRNVAHANLSVNSFPILYQARYREQQLDLVRNEIEQLISQVEQNQIPQEHYLQPGGDIEQKLLKDYIPNMLYCRKDLPAFASAQKQFRAFMEGYTAPQDIEAILSILASSRDLSKRHYRLLELYAKKISAVVSEDFARGERLRKEIDDLENNPEAS
jgi:hypothetical protein